MFVAGELLTANADDRTLRYRLLPYGQEGRTSIGRVTASRGAVTIPEDVSQLVGNIAHDRERPASQFVAVEESDEGLDVVVRAFRTRAGDDLLAEATEGARRGISVEVTDPVVRNGQLLAGTLSGAGHTTTPAFPDALLTASDTGPDPDVDEPVDEDPTDPEIDPETDEHEPDGTDPNQEENPTVSSSLTAAAAPASLGLGGAAPTMTGTPKITSANDLFATLALAHSKGDTRMLAALDEVVQADAIAAQRSQWAGEVWAQRTHRQKYVPLFNRQPLTSLKITGWKFDVRSGTAPQPPATPTVGTYAGFPAQPTSTEVRTKAVEIFAARLAGANAIDRAFVDFSSPEFWAGYYREAANDLSRKQDLYALTHMLTAANYTAVAGGTIPTGVSTAAAAIVDGVAAIQDAATPDFAVMGWDLWREFVLTRKEDALEYLSVALGLDPAEGRLDSFQFLPSTATELVGKVLVGASEAHQWYGEKVARVETVNIGTGGVETGVFAYQAANTGSASAFALVTPGADEV
jgi:hypothetical protein